MVGRGLSATVAAASIAASNHPLVVAWGVVSGAVSSVMAVVVGGEGAVGVSITGEHDWPAAAVGDGAATAPGGDDVTD